MRLTSVSIVEGGPNAPEDAAVGSFELRVERSGWTLSDPLVPGIETRWSWTDISGLIVTAGGRTADGEPVTALDVIVNGWPVRLIVPDRQLPDPGPVLLTMLAPAGHVLRGTGLVTQAAPSRRRDEPSRRRRPGRSQMLPLRSVGTAGIGAAAAVAVMVAGTVIAIAILASGSTPSTVRHDAARGHDPSATTVPSVPGPGRSPVGPATVTPAVGASGGVGAIDTVPVPVVPTTTSAGAAAKSDGAKSNGAATLTHSGDTTSSGAPTAGTSPTTTHPPSSPAPTTTKPPAPTTTAPSATTTTSKPSTTTTTSKPSTTTTTRPRRPPTTTTTRPPPTTTTPPPTTTAPPPTTTAPPPPTTTSA